MSAALQFLRTTTLEIIRSIKRAFAGTNYCLRKKYIKSRKEQNHRFCKCVELMARRIGVQIVPNRLLS